MKNLTITVLMCLSINAIAQNNKVSKKFNLNRDEGRKAFNDTTGSYKYKKRSKPIEVVKVTKADTVKVVEKQPEQVKPIVILDIQKELRSIKYKQKQSGKLLIEARNHRIESVIWSASCTAVGSIALATAKGRQKGVNFGVFVFSLGGAVSFGKMIQTFYKIGEAGRVLIK